MRILLDTCLFLWAVGEPERLSPSQRQALTDPDNAVFLSVVSQWEISITYGLGKLPLPAEPDLWLPHVRRQAGVHLLELGERAAVGVHRLPPIHRDPFDRMLISQALCDDMVIATEDETIRRYPVQTL